MDRLVDDYVGDKIPLWEKIMDRQGTVCRAWEKTAIEEGLKVGILLNRQLYNTVGGVVGGLAYYAVMKARKRQ